MITLRAKAREHRLIKLPMDKLQGELMAIRSLSKLNKDLRNRAERLEKVIRIKEYSAKKTKELIDKELEKQKNVDVSK
tara:strand:+ start:1197 stop:1430 length:234 start_codon:yes stop_codon:yes gene_type:complete